MDSFEVWKFDGNRKIDWLFCHHYYCIILLYILSTYMSSYIYDRRHQSLVATSISRLSDANLRTYCNRHTIIVIIEWMRIYIATSFNYKWHYSLFILCPNGCQIKLKWKISGKTGRYIVSVYVFMWYTGYILMLEMYVCIIYRYIDIRLRDGPALLRHQQCSTFIFSISSQRR